MYRSDHRPVIRHQFRWGAVALALVLTVFSLVARAEEKPAFQVHKQIPWASPDNIPLTLDIYVPTAGEGPYPVVVIYHGGGWLINDNSPMNAMSEYIAAKGGYVVANMNYRLLPDNNNTTTLNQMVEDVFGGLLWVKEHIAEYGGDPKRVAITGDSAGGHLASMILTRGRDLSSQGFADKRLGFNPTYLPKGKTAEQVAAQDGLAVQAAVISYGAFDLYAAVQAGFEKPENIFWHLAQAKARGIFGDTINITDHPDHYRAVSPIYHVPKAADYRLPPQFLHVAETDKVTTPESIRAYAKVLEDAGQPVQVKVYPGRNHAFLDGGCNEHLGTCFDKDAPEVLDDMLSFLDGVLKTAKSR